MKLVAVRVAGTTGIPARLLIRSAVIDKLVLALLVARGGLLLIAFKSTSMIWTTMT